MSPGCKGCLRLLPLAVLLVSAGCVTSVQLPQPINNAQRTAAPVAEDQLLDVGVRVFDPNVPQAEVEQIKQRVDPIVRGAEARYFAVHLASTLEGTGYWGQVRVVPADYSGLDVFVSGVILVSDGRTLKLDVKAVDATGRQWLAKVYQDKADTRIYKPGTTSRRDPFQNMYVAIANDLAAARARLPPAELRQVQRVAQLRFDSEMAPYAFKGYLQQARDGRMTVARLPAQDDPLANRLAQVRERDYALLDTLNDQYSLSSEQITDSYTNWRRANYQELETEDDLRRSARARTIMGAAAVVGGAVEATQSHTAIGQIAGAAGVGYGIDAIRSGAGQRTEAKTHAANIKQLSESLSSELAPVNVQVEGKVLELRGTAEQQFSEWRRLLQELYKNETG